MVADDRHPNHPDSQPTMPADDRDGRYVLVTYTEIDQVAHDLDDLLVEVLRAGIKVPDSVRDLYARLARASLGESS